MSKENDEKEMGGANAKARLVGIRMGFIGAGNMAEAIAGGLLAGESLAPGNATIIAADPDPVRRELFAKRGMKVTADNNAVLAAADVVILAVKPEVVDDVLRQLSGVDAGRHLFVSICAGITTGRIEELLPKGSRVVRAMPNTPLLVGQGAVGLCRGAHATDDDLQLACALFAAAAPVIVPLQDEQLLDAVTAVSGSGPAYVFYLTEQMIAAGIAEGLEPDDARQLAVGTVIGAGALMAREPDVDPAELRRKVTSPGGTTQAAVEHLEQAGAGADLVAAIRRAAERSRELGRAV